MTESYANPLPRQVHRRQGISKSLVVALCAGFLAALIAAGYLVRTPLVIGPLVGSKLTHLAERHDVNLRVGTFRPVGLTGLRLEQVQLITRRGSYLVEADLDSVDVTPSLTSLLNDARIHPASVEVNGGRIRITRAPRDIEQTPKAKPDAKPASAKPRGDKAPPPRPAPVRKTLTILHDISVSVRPVPLPGTTRPLVLHRAELLLATGSKARVEFRSGYGQLPDATAFALRRQPKEGPDVYLLEPQVPTRVDQWIDTRLPVGLSVSRVTLCPECKPATAELGGLRVFGPSSLVATSPGIQLSAGDSEVRLGVDAVSFAAAESPLPLRLEHLEAVYDSDTQTTTVQGDVLDGERGVAAFASSWSGQWGVLETNVQLREFHTASLWPLVGLEDKARGGVYTGKVETSFEPWLDLVEFSLDLTSKELALDVPVVTGDPLDFGQLDLQLQASFQPRARILSVSQGRASLGQADPIDFGGYALDAGTGWVFEAFAMAENLHPQRLRDGLPPNIAKLARGTEFDGEFGFDIQSAGHTAFPESIALAVDFSGHVQVNGDSNYADVLALAADGPPSIDLPGTLARNIDLDAWVDYDSLPEHVPKVLTAAEDAKFFSHDGFDWRGLRRALVHNVEQGGIERGGSTLSQQLSKNLFLDHERTLARKLQEAYVTWRLESELSKKRILELYMNMVEWGPNIRGLRAAAQRYFDVAPEELTVPQVALLASVLPGPSLFGQQVLAGYLPSSRVEKIEHILSNLRFLRLISSKKYRKLFADARKGVIGGLQLVVCDDDGKTPEGTPRCP